MSERDDLPPEMRRILAALSAARPDVRAMFRYALVLMMIDDEKARVMGTRRENGQEILAVRTVAGEEFEAVRPEMSEEVERLLLEQIREIVVDDKDKSSI